MIKKAGIISQSAFPWSSPIPIVFQESSGGGDTPQKTVKYHALCRLLLPVVKVKAHSKAQWVFSLELFPAIDEYYSMLKRSNVYSWLDCPGYHHIALLSEAQKPTLSERNVASSYVSYITWVIWYKKKVYIPKCYEVLKPFLYWRHLKK